MGKGNIIASLDLGTSKTRCMVGEINRSGDLDVLGYGISTAHGIKKGIVINIDSLVQSIVNAVELAEQMSNTKINHVAVGLSGGNISLLTNRGIVAIPKSEGEITHQDVERVLQAAKIMAISHDQEIIDVIPRDFIVDGCDGIKDPVGMVGTRLEVSACIVTGLLTAIQNIVRCVQKANLTVESMILKPLAAAEILLTEDEMDMGVALVDVGAGTTEIAIFQNGCIMAYEMLPIGGDLITNDIAIGLRLPYSQAEEIKCKHACTLSHIAADELDIEIQRLGDNASRKVSQQDLTAIVKPRVQEILLYVNNFIHGFNLKTMLPAGIVFTGGGLVHIKGLFEMAQQLLEPPVRLATDSFDREQSFTVALGLLNYVINHRAFYRGSAMKERSALGFLEKIKQIFKEYF